MVQHIQDSDSDISSWIGRLSTGDQSERNRAARVLASAGATAIHELCVALTFGSCDVRRAAAWALGQVGGGDEAVSALIDALHDLEAAVRGAAAEALGRIGDQSALIPLEIAATSDDDSKVRAIAASALTGLGPTQQNMN